MQNPNQKPLKSWKKFQLSFFSKGFLYTVSSGIHLFTFMAYFLILSQYLDPFGYHNPAFWFSFYIFYTFVAIALFIHGLRTLYRFFHTLPQFEDEIDMRGYETERLTQE